MIVVLSNPKNSKSYKLEAENIFTGKKIGDEIDLNAIGINAKGIITGGSTKEGTPMAPFLKFSGYKRVLLKKGFAFKNAKRKGEMKRKLLHGAVISDRISAVNIKLIELNEDLDAKFAKKEKEE